MTNWIRVDDDKPEYDVDVIIFTPRDHALSPKTIIGWYCIEGYWASTQANEDEDIFPTHWMPKPLDPTDETSVQRVKYEIFRSDLEEVICNLKSIRRRLHVITRTNVVLEKLQCEVTLLNKIIRDLETN